MTKMAAMSIYGKNLEKNILHRNRQANFHETWYVALGTPDHHSFFSNDDPGVTLTLFYRKVKFGIIGFTIGKWENSGYFRNYCSQ